MVQGDQRHWHEGRVSVTQRWLDSTLKRADFVSALFFLELHPIHFIQAVGTTSGFEPSGWVHGWVGQSGLILEA